MKTLRILHLSDLHRLPEGGEKPAEKNDSAIKDNSVDPTPLLNGPWENQFIDEITGWTNRNAEIDAIVCTGDLGSEGNPESIRQGAQLIVKIARALKIDNNNVMVCPGNHDLDRNGGDKAFDSFKNSLTQEKITNFCDGTNPCSITPKGLPIIAVNSCMGGTQRSLFFQEYKQWITSMIQKNGGRFNEDEALFENEISKLTKRYVTDYYDIPSITPVQLKDLVSKIDDLTTSCKIDSIIVMMHHHLLPCGPLEIKPYSNIIDASETIHRLRQTGKNIFVLHGHVHRDAYTITFAPDHRNRFISTLGTGTCDGGPGSSVNILEFFFTDDGYHLVTKVSPFKVAASGGYNFLGISHPIYDYRLSPDEHQIKYDDYIKGRPITFDELSKKTNLPNDDSLMRVLLLDPSVIMERRGDDSNYKQWRFSKQI